MMAKKTLHMNAGDGDTSYATNSTLQKVVMSKSLGVLDWTLRDMLSSFCSGGDNKGFPRCLKMADFGCASGPNTLHVISHIRDTIKEIMNDVAPEFEVFLNDLWDNDFNNLFKLLSSQYEEERRDEDDQELFISGLPGSFYGRLLPSSSLHLAYSSYCLHWLSQIPDGVDNNKGNICIANTSPGQVLEAYSKQFRWDFSRFLRCRGQEMIPGGRLVFTLHGRSVPNFSSEYVCEHFMLLSQVLETMVAEGLVKEEELHSFNMPYYTPCPEEVEAIVEKQGSFNLDRMESCRVPWDANSGNLVFNKGRSGKLVSHCIRAITEPLLAPHFSGGVEMIDDLFARYAVKAGDHLASHGSFYFTIIVSLRRK